MCVMIIRVLSTMKVNNYNTVMKTRNILSGADSILDTAPARRQFKIEFPNNPSEITQIAWEHVGSDIRTAISSIENESKNIKKTK